MKNKHSDGQNLTLIAPYNVASGAGLKVGGIFAVAICAALLGEAVAAKREGAFALAALSSDTASVGDPAYWDDEARRIATYGSTPYDGIADGEDLAFKYTDASGAQLGSIESTGFLDGSADAHREHLFGGEVTPAANAALVLHMLAGNIATGDSPLKVRVRYRVVSLLA